MKKTILFVDDEEINLFVLEKRFEPSYNIKTANSGPEALSIVEAQAEEIDFLISDMRMPEMDGLELIHKVKGLTSSLPCFLLTGYDQTSEVDEAIANNVIARLFKKPFEYEEINDVLQSYAL